MPRSELGTGIKIVDTFTEGLLHLASPLWAYYLGPRIAVSRQGIIDAGKNYSNRYVGGKMGKKMGDALVGREPHVQEPFTYEAYIELEDDEGFWYTARDGKRSYLPAAVELGHFDQAGNWVAPKPWLRPAFEDVGPKELEKLLKGFMRDIERDAKKFAKVRDWGRPYTSLLGVKL